MQKKRKTPLRKCTGCGEMKNKKELIRVVRDADNAFSLDAKGRNPGRGAYVCPGAECLAKARKSHGLERSFKQSVPPEIYDSLTAELEKLSIDPANIEDGEDNGNIE